MDEVYKDLQRQITDLRRELDEFRAYSRLDIMTLAQCWPDHFYGDQINARWNPAAVGVGAIAPVLQANSPSRVLFDTGAGAIGASSLLNEAATFKYAPAAGISMFCILKQSNSLTNVVADVLRLSDGTVNNNVMIRHNSAVGGNYFLRTVSGGVASSVDMGVAADITTYHTFALTLRTGVLRGRIDGGVVFQLTTNVPTANLGIWYEIADQTAAASKQMELDLHFSCPGVVLF
jgi:hypothetical protein